MSRHPWKQIISDYYISGLAKCKFISQYHQTYPEVKLCRTSFYNKLGLFEQALHAGEASLSMGQSLPSGETTPEHSYTNK